VSAASAEEADTRVTVVVATRDRCDQLMRTLDKLAGLPERPPVVVVDNGSTDPTVAAVRSEFPAVHLIELGDNRGLEARNLGVEQSTTPYVAFCDDDSWWAAGALARAADTFDAVSRLGLLAARVLVGDEAGLDPVSAAMAEDLLPSEADLPGPAVLGFIACGTVVRRTAFLEVGGFEPLLFFYGEEQLLAIDLVRAGWGLAYVDEVVAHHHPSPARNQSRRHELEVRNAVLSAWMRRPLGPALAITARALVSGWSEPAARQGLLTAFRKLPAALARRQVVDRALEQRVRLLEHADHTAHSGTG
jgi:GT2 family glycosyltransferase